jgi:hypothetical protein
MSDVKNTVSVSYANQRAGIDTTEFYSVDEPLYQQFMAAQELKNNPFVLEGEELAKKLRYTEGTTRLEIRVNQFGSLHKRSLPGSFNKNLILDYSISTPEFVQKQVQVDLPNKEHCYFPFNSTTLFFYKTNDLIYLHDAWSNGNGVSRNNVAEMNNVVLSTFKMSKEEITTQQQNTSFRAFSNMLFAVQETFEMIEQEQIAKQNTKPVTV